MYEFTVQCPLSNKLYNVSRNNYKSANVLERQLIKAKVNYQLLN